MVPNPVAFWELEEEWKGELKLCFEETGDGWIWVRLSKGSMFLSAFELVAEN